MRGGSGNDIYYVDNVGDSITENPGDGTDRVKSRIDFVLILFINRVRIGLRS